MEIKTYDLINEKLYHYVHESGLNVYVMPKKDFGKSYASFATNFGSVDNVFTFNGEETVLPDGVAHFLEHKMFEEPDRNIFADFAALGASANAYTSFDMTTYLFSATANFYESLKVLLGYVQNPYFTDENVSKEQGIIGQEIGMYNDDPSWNVFFNMLRAMYKNHSINKDIAGSVESIAKIDKDLLYKCHDAFYNPGNMVLFVVGDVCPEKVVELVCDNIKLKSRPDIKVKEKTEPREILKPYIEQAFSIAKPMFCLGFKEIPSQTPVRTEAQFMILLEMLFGKSSEIYQKMYDSELIDAGFVASYSAGKGYSFVEMSGESNNPQKVRDKVLEYLSKIRSGSLNEKDFIRTKNSVYGKILRSLNSVEGISGEFLSMLLRGGDFLSLAEEIKNTTLTEVEKLLGDTLSADRSVLSVAVPFNS